MVSDSLLDSLCILDNSAMENGAMTSHTVCSDLLFVSYVLAVSHVIWFVFHTPLPGIRSNVMRMAKGLCIFGIQGTVKVGTSSLSEIVHSFGYDSPSFFGHD